MKEKIINIIYKISIFVIVIWGIYVLSIGFRVCCLASFRVSTDSMSPAILPGDNMLAEKLSFGGRLFNIFDALDGRTVKVQRLPALSRIERNDVLVFNMPYVESWDSLVNPVGNFYIKRCVALPGDTLEIRNGIFHVSGYQGILGNADRQIAMSYKLNGVKDDSLALKMGIYLDAWPLNSDIGWTVMEFGPVFIPSSGSEVDMNPETYLLYGNYIEWEQKEKLSCGPDGCIMLGDKQIDTYTFLKDYYFVAGDNVENSQDSRYWGLLPEDYICAKVWRIWKSVDPVAGHIRWNRIGRKVI